MNGEVRPGVAEALAALDAFGIDADAPLVPIDSGHINESFLVPGPQPLLLQWLNHAVFADVERVQRNAERALAWLAEAGLPVPALLAGESGGVRRTASGLWRACHWVPGRRTLQRSDDVPTITACADTLGAVLARLGALPVDEIEAAHEGFHDSVRRMAGLRRSLASATDERRERAAVLLERLNAQHDVLGAPMERCAVQVLHGDTKLSNFLLAAPVTASPPLLIDWDTVMVGPIAWDFGDFARGCCSRGAEDDVERAGVDEALLLAAVRAFRARLPRALRADEDTLASLARAPAYIAHVLALRFLTDHLDGDRYFRVADPGHNLRRAETQARLAEAFGASSDRLFDLFRERSA